jgi:molybdate-binding protein
MEALRKQSKKFINNGSRGAGCRSLRDIANFSVNLRQIDGYAIQRRVV